MIEVYIESNRMGIHLVSPHNHHVNAAKRAIATFKEHTLLWGWPLLTETALYNCGMNFCTKSSSHSTLSIFHATTPENLPMRRSRARMTSTKLRLRQSVLKALSTTTPQSTTAGHRTELMHFMLAPPPSTISVFDSTC
jgi:hypothetical protein